jgi:ribosome maturation factor RimP
VNLCVLADLPAAESNPREEEAAPGASRGLRKDWARLTGHTVEVWLRGEHVASGLVEQAAEDGSVLWIAGEGITTRRLFDKSTGYQVWL